MGSAYTNEATNAVKQIIEGKCLLKKVNIG